MIKTLEREVIKPIAAGVMIYHQGDPCRNENGGDYTEVEYVFVDDKKRHYRTYTSSSEFDYCPLYGLYTSCESCPDGYSDWKMEKRICSKCSEKENCSFNQFLNCSNQYDLCQNPRAVYVEYNGRLYLALPIE
jgi:hypothetical protein